MDDHSSGCISFDFIHLRGESGQLTGKAGYLVCYCSQLPPQRFLPRPVALACALDHYPLEFALQGVLFFAGVEGRGTQLGTLRRVDQQLGEGRPLGRGQLFYRGQGLGLADCRDGGKPLLVVIAEADAAAGGLLELLKLLLSRPCPFLQLLQLLPQVLIGLLQSFHLLVVDHDELSEALLSLLELDSEDLALGAPMG